MNSISKHSKYIRKQIKSKGGSKVIESSQGILSNSQVFKFVFSLKALMNAITTIGLTRL